VNDITREIEIQAKHLTDLRETRRRMIREFLAAGHTQNQAAEEFGVHQSTVRHLISALYSDLRPRDR
jgi:transposase